MRKAGTSAIAVVAALCTIFVIGPDRQAGAVPACPEPATVRQPDGREIKIYLKGDESFHWHEDADGFTILKDARTGRWVHATRGADGKLVPSASVVGRDDPTKLGVPRHMLPARAGRAAAPSGGDPLSSEGGPSRLPTIGVMKNLVVLVEFSDLASTRTKEEYEALFNTVGYNVDGAQGSVKDYYDEVSYNALDVQSVVTDWVTLDHGYAFYGRNDVTGYDRKPREMVEEALAKLDAGGFDFSTLDADNDGWVDGLTIIHAGGGEEYAGNDPDYIWSHYWELESPVTYDGKMMQPYHTEPERRGWDSSPSTWGITRIGVICHETGHFLGLPDLYDYDYDSRGAGEFCLMAGGSWNGDDGTQPAHMSAWCKKTLNWLTPTVITEGGIYDAPRVEDNPTVFRLSGPFPSTEYFLLENRQGFGFDAGLPGSTRGLLIWHVDETQPDNDDQTHYMVDLEEAGGTQHLELNLNGGDDADYYREGNNTTFTALTTPNNLSYSGTPLGLDIVSVSPSAPTMTFTIDDGTIVLPPPVLSAEPPTTPGTTNTVYWTPGSEPQPSPAHGEVSGPASTPKTGTIPTTGAACPHPPTPAAAVRPPGKSPARGRSNGKYNVAGGPPAQSPQTLFTETFEGDFPGSNWALSGSPTWDDTTYDSHGGSYSGWCAASSRNPADGYVDDMAAWMIYGPFSLVGATTADVNFWYRNYSESGYDYFSWMASTNGQNFYGWQISGDRDSWRSEIFDLTDVYTIGNLCGESQVWIAFLFTSDLSTSGPEYKGAFVDDISLVTDAQQLADLQVPELAWRSDTIDEGLPFWVQGRIYNGGALAAEASHVKLYLSTDNDFDTSDDFYVGEKPVGALAAGASEWVQWDFDMPDIGSGNYSVWPVFVADSQNEVTESNENNTYKSTSAFSASDPLEYYAECADNADFNPPFDNSGWILNTEWTFAGLTPDQTYWYRVKAGQGSGPDRVESDWSNVESSTQLQVQTHTLTVQSTPIAGVGITGDKPGTTDYAATCDDQEVVNLTAPASVVVADQEYSFVRWVVDGGDQPPCETSLTITMDADHTAAARYALTGDLTGDCQVDVLDLVAMRNHLFDDTATDDNCLYDLSGDGQISVLDMIVVRNHLYTACGQ